MIDDVEEEKDTDAAVPDEALEEALGDEVEDEEVEADLTDEFGNPKEETPNWE